MKHYCYVEILQLCMPQSMFNTIEDKSNNNLKRWCFSQGEKDASLGLSERWIRLSTTAADSTLLMTIVKEAYLRFKQVVPYYGKKQPLVGIFLSALSSACEALSVGCEPVYTIDFNGAQKKEDEPKGDEPIDDARYDASIQLSFSKKEFSPLKVSHILNGVGESREQEVANQRTCRIILGIHDTAWIHLDNPAATDSALSAKQLEKFERGFIAGLWDALETNIPALPAMLRAVFEYQDEPLLNNSTGWYWDVSPKVIRIAAPEDLEKLDDKKRLKCLSHMEFARLLSLAHLETPQKDLFDKAPKHYPGQKHCRYLGVLRMPAYWGASIKDGDKKCKGYTEFCLYLFSKTKLKDPLAYIRQGEHYLAPLARTKLVSKDEAVQAEPTIISPTITATHKGDISSASKVSVCEGV